MSTEEQYTRQMTICSKGYARTQHRYVFFPVLRLAGKWLEDCGFKSGHLVDIECREGQLIITIAKEQRFEDL